LKLEGVLAGRSGEAFSGERETRDDEGQANALEGAQGDEARRLSAGGLERVDADNGAGEGDIEGIIPEALGAIEEFSLELALRPDADPRDRGRGDIAPPGSEAARDEELSRAIIEAIQRVDPGLLLFCMQASVTYQLAQKMDQPVVAEFYADREYNDDAQIVFTRSVAEELDPEEVGDRVVRAVTEKKVKAESGKDIDVASDSVCVHGDTPGAVRLAEAIARKLGENDIEIRPLGRAQQRIS